MGQFGWGQKATVTYDWVAAHLNNNALFAFYVIAIVGTCYHFANGMWEFCIDWGFTIGPKAQRISLYVWSVFFIALTALGIGAAAGFRMHPAAAVGQTPAAITMTAPAAGTP
jgi:succinate dehydrogenase/fumarate reductase cytochrome b subunit